MQICVLDEPTNFLDREALGGLAIAIKNWNGAVVSFPLFCTDPDRGISDAVLVCTQVIISHNHEFVSSLCA